MGKVITIDGPAASGKTTISRELAKRLGWQWVSTGAFYRGLAYVAQLKKVDLKDENALQNLTQSSAWSVEMDPQSTRVMVDGQDVTPEIFQEQVGTIASQISQFPKVRQALLQGQRECQARSQGLIAEGRDCGTVVFPEAEVKIYITASSENRAERRAKEQGLDAQQTEQVQQQRDQQDAQRKVAPLQIPPDAFVLDTTQMPLEEVISRVEAHVRQNLK